jgi:FkbM family methyltransferase
MLKSLTHYQRRLADKGVGGIIASRWRWYKQSFQMNNWLIGRLIELTGNKITVDGVTLCVDNPQIMTMHKSSIYFGIYEIAERDLARRHIDPSLPLVEIGASIGGVSCITNKLLSDPLSHVVVECNPNNVPTLTRNREINGCKFTIEPFALAYGSDTVTFNIVPGGWMVGNIKGLRGREVSVPTITLKQILAKHGFQIISLISDCEGTEVEMIENEPDVLRSHVKNLIIETHPELRGEDTTAKVLHRLTELGFELSEQNAEKQVFALSNRHLHVRP